MNSAFVIAMGMGTVFIGLICIILLCKIASAVVRLSERQPAQKAITPAAAVSAAPAVSAAKPALQGEERRKVLAAVCAVLAEEMGVEVEALKVVSFKQI